MGRIASESATNGKLEVPQTVAEAAVFAGKLHRMASDFALKWGGKAPPEGTPEAAAYQKEMEAVTTNFAAVMKSFGDNSLEEVIAKPASVAQFQSLQLYGSLELNEAQLQQLEATLNRYYTEGYGRKLNGASRPKEGVEAWQQQQDSLNQRAYKEIQTMLSPQQRADFTRYYKPSFLWEVNMGGGGQ